MIHNIQNLTALEVRPIKSSTQKWQRKPTKNFLVFKVSEKILQSSKNLSFDKGSGAKKLHLKYIAPFEISVRISKPKFLLNLLQPLTNRKSNNAFHAGQLLPHNGNGFY